MSAMKAGAERQVSRRLAQINRITNAARLPRSRSGILFASPPGVVGTSTGVGDGSTVVGVGGAVVGVGGEVVGVGASVAVGCGAGVLVGVG